MLHKASNYGCQFVIFIQDVYYGLCAVSNMSYAFSLRQSEYILPCGQQASMDKGLLSNTLKPLTRTSDQVSRYQYSGLWWHGT